MALFVLTLWLAGALALAGRVLSPAGFDEALPSYARFGLWERLALAAALGTMGPVWLVHGLGLAHALTPVLTAVASVAVALVLFAVAGAAGRRTARDDLRAFAAALREALGSGLAAGFVLGAVVALALALWATYLLIPWAWDALGYHLPLVYDALATRTLREVPSPAPYINAYPHATDVFTLWWRLLLADDTWIECTQVPYAFLGVFSAASLAERAGASRGRALAYALAWLCVPAVALQLACNYVDVAFGAWLLMAAAFVAGPLDARGLLLTTLGVAGLLSTKPSAPPAAVLVLVALVVRLVLMKRRGEPLAPPWAFALGALVLLGGAGTYLENLVRYANPLYPVRMKVGPLALPGKVDSSYFFNLGLPLPMRSRGWLYRLLYSWFVPPDRYIYDQRGGGLGPVFALGALPLSALVLARRENRARAWPFIVVFLGSIASPGAFWSRYTVAAPAALFALVAAGSERWSLGRRRLADGLMVSLALASLWLSRGGWTDNGPRLWQLASQRADARALTVNIDNHEADWRRARAWVGPGEGFSYEMGFGLPGQLWAAHGQGRVEFLEHRAASPDALVRWVRARRVRAAVFCDPPEGSLDLARQRPDVFEEAFRVPYDACFAFRVR